jgi:predicted glycoside hydrolase/deacetylase ChbG (UPF0249 family)
VAVRTRLIVNADDLGESRGVNRGIALAHAYGIVTSASLLVDGPAATQAADWASRQRVDLGLHLDFGEWRYRDGSWDPIREVVDLSDATAVETEARRQLEAFRRLMDRNPSHIDSHQHVHRRQPVRSVVCRLAAKLDVPLRHFSAAVRYCGEFYGQSAAGSPLEGALTPERLEEIIARLPAGVTELCCHPGVGGDVSGMYRNERTTEVEILCDPRVRGAVRHRGVELVSFEALA